MGNLMQYTNKSKTLDNRLSSLLNEIEMDYKNGNIKSETEYHYRIKNMLQGFYRSILKPSFVFRKAKDVPISNHYNSMVKEAYEDLKYIIEDSEILSENIKNSYTEAETTRSMMKEELNFIQKQIELIKENIAKNTPKGSTVFSEQFNDTKNNITISENSCSIDSSFGYLTLPIKTMAAVRVNSIEIDNEQSNGFPGNTHVVNTLNNQIHFVGEENLKNQISSIENSNQDDWFEYEIIDVSPEVQAECNHFGFEYDEGISWLKQESVLRLKININVHTDKVCSWINLFPFLSEIKGAKPCYIEKCYIVGTDGSITKIGENISFHKNTVIVFKPQTLSRIELTFVQGYGYDTNIGHLYYQAINTKNMSIFSELTIQKDLPRVNGPNPSLTMLGLTYDPVNKKFLNPTNKTDLLSKTYVSANLFQPNMSDVDKKASLEVLPAKRYMIGISQISLASYVFKEFGTYVSASFTTEESITSISLDSNEFIPEGYDYSCMRYYISLDDGHIWHEITPLKRPYIENTIYKYNINNDSIENLLIGNTSLSKTKNINVFEEVRSIKVKIEMDLRKETSIYEDVVIEEQYATPIVYDYKLLITTGGETIEY